MLYSALLTLHSILRWAVVFAGLYALVLAVRGRAQRREWTAADNRAGGIFVAALDTQFLVGLLLYVFVSPISRAAMQDFGAAMRDQQLRFFAVEHGVMAVLALVAAHVGRVRSRKANDPAGKHGRAAVAYALAMIAIAVTIPWPFLAYGRPWIRFGG